MILICFQDKQFNITVILACILTTNDEEAEVDWFNEDLQDLELTHTCTHTHTQIHTHTQNSFSYRGSDQISRSVVSALCDSMNHSTPSLPVHHQLTEFTETHVHRVSDAIQPSHPLSSPSPPAPNPSQHQSLFQ